MPAKDELHDAVGRALEKAGWKIVSFPRTIKFNRRTLHLDIVAERDGQSIVVEVKGDSLAEMDVLERAVGQFLIYRHVLERDFPRMKVFLAAPADAVADIFGASHSDGENLRQNLDLHLIVFDSQKEEIIQWIQ